LTKLDPNSNFNNPVKSPHISKMEKRRKRKADENSIAQPPIIQPIYSPQPQPIQFNNYDQLDFPMDHVRRNLNFDFNQMHQFNTISNSQIQILPNSQLIQHNLKGIVPYDYIN
jgi:hypothetical protein